MATLDFVIPTRDRHDELARTLAILAGAPAERIGGGPRGGRPRVIIVDNGSDPPVAESISEGGAACANGLRIEVIRLEENLGAAARNIGAEASDAEWVVMLDDDSAPVGGDLVRTLGALPAGVAAYGAQIRLPGGGREAGGLPEVVIGCGCAYRREVFLGVGGYDALFDYYAEEYDLCAKLIREGHAVVHGMGVVVEHRKAAGGRDFGRILYRLVRNNVWVAARYAPLAERDPVIGALLERYERIAAKEGVPDAFERGRDDALATLGDQAFTPLDADGWRRFTGEAAVADHLIRKLVDRGTSRVRLVEPGKGEDSLGRVLAAHGVGVDDLAQTRVIGTLSPGPMLDAHDRDPGALMAWSLAGEARGRIGEGAPSGGRASRGVEQAPPP